MLLSTELRVSAATNLEYVIVFVSMHLWPKLHTKNIYRLLYLLLTSLTLLKTNTGSKEA